jgi:hypothetical protein
MATMAARLSSSAAACREDAESVTQCSRRRCLFLQPIGVDLCGQGSIMVKSPLAPVRVLGLHRSTNILNTLAKDMRTPRT